MASAADHRECSWRCPRTRPAEATSDPAETSAPAVRRRHRLRCSAALLVEQSRELGRKWLAGRPSTSCPRGRACRPPFAARARRSAPALRVTRDARILDWPTGPTATPRQPTEESALEIACLIFASQLGHEVHEGHEVHAGPSSTNLVEGIMPSVWELEFGSWELGVNAVLFVSQRDDGFTAHTITKVDLGGLAVALPEEQKTMPIRHSTWSMRALFTSTLLAGRRFAIGYARQTPPQITPRQREPAPGRMDGPVPGEADARFATTKPASFEATPIVVDGTMYVGNAPGEGHRTGRRNWSGTLGVRFADRTQHPVQRFRQPRRIDWLDEAARMDTPCRRRIFAATAQSQLIALDARTDSRA